MKPEVRFNHQRISEQRTEAAEVARRIKEVRVFGGGVVGGGEPFLEQGSSGSEHEDRNAYGFGEDQQHPERRIAMLERAVLVRTDGKRQNERSQQQNNQVEQRLEAAKMLKAKMCVSVSH